MNLELASWSLAASGKNNRQNTSENKCLTLLLQESNNLWDMHSSHIYNGYDTKLCLEGYFWDDEWLLNFVLLSVRKPQPLPVPVMPFRVCCPWPTPLPLPHLHPLHLPYLFLEDLQRVWGRSRKKVAGLYGWLEGPKRQEVLTRNLSSSGLENDQLNDQPVTLVRRRVQMSKKLWEPVLKIQTMVSSMLSAVGQIKACQSSKIYSCFTSCQC